MLSGYVFEMEKGKFFKENRENVIFNKCCYCILLFCRFYFLDPLTRYHADVSYRRPTNHRHVHICHSLLGGIRLAGARIEHSFSYPMRVKTLIGLIA